ncbi:hypothetical protein AVT69_gp256 [Pseudomonas phage PhiPA3]|uniref:Uncharacterized protein 258 n=1 Tax=Pseudomonas phage PhiPA3 TaxID=998086 RepID=F8SJ98_BPPA3|nr:hypothetical protein AVT69_gp256 [Pseudomonas phage PhiPA3]AEH03681.1 hypothetical protein [Pseudomonas phage PhiPA3]
MLRSLWSGRMYPPRSALNFRRTSPMRSLPTRKLNPINHSTCLIMSSARLRRVFTGQSFFVRTFWSPPAPLMHASAPIGWSCIRRPDRQLLLYAYHRKWVSLCPVR